MKELDYGSIEPRWLTEDNILKLSKVNKLCHYFHLSVQSLSDSVLNRMNRKYTSEYVSKVVYSLRKTFKDVAITCDIIVGYINETDEEFNETYNLIKELEFTDLNVFKFSKRKYTKAYSMETNVTPITANKRSKLLIELGKELKTKYYNKYIGGKKKVLLEEYKSGYLYGYTDNYIKIKVKGDESLWGTTKELELILLEKDLILGMLK